ncbi:MAG: protein kinase domain-containing protein [Nocardioides sp.]
MESGLGSRQHPIAGRYVLVDRIGAGSTGSVWRAYDQRTRSWLALKVLTARSGSVLLRFVREQGVRIPHPHVVAPTGWVAEDDLIVLTMDLVCGGSVADLLAGHGTLPEPLVGVLLDQLLQALAAVHATGTVHRDVKPANLLLEATGRDVPHLRLADFGVAAGREEPRLTRTPGGVGTDGYLAPEQEAGGPPDPRSDLYAAGRVGIELLTGSPTSPVPGGALAALLTTLTAPEPEDRPASAVAALVELRTLALPPCDGSIPIPDRLPRQPLPPPEGLTEGLALPDPRTAQRRRHTRTHRRRMAPSLPMTRARWWHRSKRRTDYRAGVDAVVVNYRTPEDLEGFVASLAEHSDGVDVSLVVANVAPRQGDLEAGERALGLARDGLAIRHLVFEDNVGYARACNAGLLGGTHDVIGLFNADVRLTADALATLARVVRENPTWGAVGPRQVDQLGRITSGGTLGTNEQPKQRGWRQDDIGQFSDIREDAVAVAGSAYLMRRGVWEELSACRAYRRVAPGAEGAFLPTRLFYEETFCSYHATAHGYRNVYYGPVQIIHTWHGSIDSNDAPATDLFAESREYFRRACDAHGIAHD